jgi:hypothetical protein
MAGIFNGQIAGMTAAQFEALPPHKKLLHATAMPNEFLMNNAIHSRRQPGQPPILTFQPVYPRTMRLSVVKRPLNSFMAFRCMSPSPRTASLSTIRLTSTAYYIQIFDRLQQKDASTLACKLWEEDLFKAKWSVVARAYSDIRDHVGKPRAPLNRYFDLVIPEVGIILFGEYLQKMCWQWEEKRPFNAEDLNQTSVPDIASFDARIQNTLMTERDIVHFCAQHGYISHPEAFLIAGAAQHGLLATAPGAPAGAPGAAIDPPTNNYTFLVQATADPHLAASDVLGFDVAAFLGLDEDSELPDVPSPAESVAYPWTGCLADVYSPAEGTFEYEALARHRAARHFDIGDISNPRSFDEMFAPVVQDGYFQPTSKQP